MTITTNKLFVLFFCVSSVAIASQPSKDFVNVLDKTTLISTRGKKKNYSASERLPQQIKKNRIVQRRTERNNKYNMPRDYFIK
jgi:hypothetical protein